MDKYSEFKDAIQKMRGSEVYCYMTTLELKDLRNAVDLELAYRDTLKHHKRED